jgi:tetratricopeptide (TPR) repeat protein
MKSVVDSRNALCEIKQHIRRGEYVNAQEMLQPYLEANSSSDEAYSLMGHLHSLNHRHVEAVSCYVRAGEINPLNFNHYLSLARTLFEQRWYDQSAIAARRALDLEPESIESVMLLSKIEEIRGRKDIAITLLQRAVDLLNRRNERQKELDPCELGEVCRPLVISGIHFLEFEGRGDFGHFELHSLSSEGNYRLEIEVWPVFEDPLVSSVSVQPFETSFKDIEGDGVRWGVIERSKLILSLPLKIQHQIELSGKPRFNYTITRQVSDTQ